MRKLKVFLLQTIVTDGGEMYYGANIYKCFFYFACSSTLGSNATCLSQKTTEVRLKCACVHALYIVILNLIGHIIYSSISNIVFGLYGDKNRCDNVSIILLCFYHLIIVSICRNRPFLSTQLLLS